MTISNLADDVEFWGTDDGVFTFAIPTATPMPTATAGQIPSTTPGGLGILLAALSILLTIAVIKKR